jgi:hypothetical protein
LTADKLDPRIVQQLEDTSVNTLALLGTSIPRPFLDTITIVDQVMQANCKEPSLDALRTQAAQLDPNLTLFNRILLY